MLFFLLASWRTRGAVRWPLSTSPKAAPPRADRRRFYRMALGSTRECEALIQRVGLDPLSEDIDLLARHIYRLCKALE